jgi:AraC-like DNA-binding protein
MSKESFINLLRFIIDDIGVEKVFFSSKNPLPKGKSSFMDTDSLDIPLSGRKRMEFASGGEIRNMELRPGEVHFAPSLRWKRPVWDIPHAMSSIVYHNDHIRITYINHESPAPSLLERPPAEIFFHTSAPLNIIGMSILKTLTLMAESGDDSGAAEAMRSLLIVTLAVLENDAPSVEGKAYRTWLTISQYIREHFDSPINRAHVAKTFNLNPSYVSRLFNTFSDENFNVSLRRIRLEHAAILLEQTDLTIDEVTDTCGYLSSTYFIAAFHKHYGMPPGKYRVGRRG